MNRIVSGCCDAGHRWACPKDVIDDDLGVFSRATGIRSEQAEAYWQWLANYELLLSAICNEIVKKELHLPAILGTYQNSFRRMMQRSWVLKLGGC